MRSERKIYDRLRDLPGLLPLWPAELDDFTPEGTLKLVRILENAIRAERLRGTSGHWAYDLGRHLTLARAYKAECARYRIGCGGNGITALQPAAKNSWREPE